MVTRDVTPEECHWLDRTIAAGTLVYSCKEATYGCVKEFAATFSPDGGYPFFELPWNSIVKDGVE